MQRTPRLAALPLVASLLAAPSVAQTLFAVESGGSVVEWAGPADPATGYPNGFPRLSFSHAAGPCPPAALAAPPSLLGDVAANRASNLVWMTDGQRFAAFDPQGNFVRSFQLLPGMALPGAVTGMGMDGASGTIWVTDGTQFASLQPPAVDCAPPTVLAGPVALPFSFLATDIAYDPSSGTLWTCDDNGMVTNVDPATGGIGPHGSFAAAPGSCGLGAMLQGIAVDHATAGAALYVTDGSQVAYLDTAGGLAPTTFYSPVSCYAVPGAPVLGLTQTSHAVGYGAGDNSCDGCPAPRLRLYPQMVAGASFTIELEGGNPASDLPVLFFSPTPTSPIALPIGGVLYQAMTWSAPMPALSGGGLCNGATSVTGTVPMLVGFDTYFQGFLVSAGPCLKSTAGASFRISAP